MNTLGLQRQMLGSSSLLKPLSAAPVAFRPSSRIALTVNARGGGGGGRGGAGRGDENPLSKFFSDFQEKLSNMMPKGSGGDGGDPWASGAGGGKGRGGRSGGGGGGGGGDGGGFGGDEPPPAGPEQPILQELLALFKGMWTVFWNTALFLAVADVLHRSLDWCCQVELLLLVGAPQQAFERVSARFFAMVEWMEEHLLGWDIPKDDDMIPTYQNIALYYPEDHAYTFDAYRYGNMTEAEKKALKYAYSLKHYERDGGYRGDVDMADVAAIQDKYEPMEADRRAYQLAKARGQLDKYWEAKAAANAK